jgi:hypothetical protein
MFRSFLLNLVSSCICGFHFQVTRWSAHGLQCALWR